MLYVSYCSAIRMPILYIADIYRFNDNRGEHKLLKSTNNVHEALILYFFEPSWIGIALIDTGQAHMCCTRSHQSTVA